MSNTTPVVELELYLIRHGQTTSNIKGLDTSDFAVIDREDPMLTPLGKKQAEALGLYFKDKNFDAVYSSCLRRAVETAGEIIKNQSRDLPLLADPVFSEANIDRNYRGSSFEELKKICPAVIPSPDADFSEGMIEGIETDDDYILQHRAAKIISKLRDKYKKGERVAVVMHAGILTHCVFYLLGYRDSVPDGTDIAFFNTSFTKIIFYKKGTYRYGEVVFENMNDISHLRDFD